jgi:aspartate ammonia-lyase
MANDSAITMAAAHGEFELNAFTPLIADCLLESLELLINAARLFRQRCIKTLSANADNCRDNLNRSYAFATPYAAKLGYDIVSATVNNNPPEKAREILDALVKEKE